MDYAGRDFRNIRYVVNRPLTDEERETHYRQRETGDADPSDFLSVIRFNETYIDLVDRWYPVTGFSVWLGCLIGFACLYGIFGMWDGLLNGLAEVVVGSVVALLVLTVFMLFLCGAGIFMVGTECFRWTHYPMRLNRKTRQVHVFRQNGTVLTVPWDDLFIVRGEAKSPMMGTTYDLRAHVLDADGTTVRESFSLGYTFPCDEKSMDKFWAFLQPYMEAADGVERTANVLKDSFLMPVDGRKEGWRWSIARTFAPGGRWPWAQLLLCIPLGLNAVGRMFAMWTSGQPAWPAEVEAAGVVDADDPYRRTWRDNPPLGWWELYWPLLCTVIGVGLFVGVIAMIVARLWA